MTTQEIIDHLGVTVTLLEDGARESGIQRIHELHNLIGYCPQVNLETGIERTTWDAGDGTVRLTPTATAGVYTAPDGSFWSPCSDQIWRRMKTRQRAATT